MKPHLLVDIDIFSSCSANLPASYSFCSSNLILINSFYTKFFVFHFAKDIVSFPAIIRVVMQCTSPTNGCSLELCIPFLKLINKEQASISWKPGPFAANVTRDMIGEAANSYMHVVGSQ